MNFTGFKQQDFDTFLIEGLEERMAAIEERIRPKFRVIGQELTDDLAVLLGEEMYLHIAKHARRTVNPPQDTWLAVANNKRGYKKHPHFQIGLFDDHLFVWIAFIYELPEKQKIAKKFIQNEAQLKEIIPADYVISLDHMKKGAIPFTDIDLNAALNRFHDVKKAEFLIGRHFQVDDPLLQKPAEFMEEVKETFYTLLPLYKLAREAYELQ